MREKNLSFVLSNPLIARESDVRHTLCAGGAAYADPAVRGQGWSPPGLYLGSSLGEGAPSSDLILCQGQMTHSGCVGFEPSTEWKQGGEICQSLGMAVQSSRLSLFFLPLSHQVGAYKV